MAKTIKEISSLFENTNIENINDVINEFKNDNRIGIQKLISKYENLKRSYYLEIKRIKKLNEFENNYYENGLSYIGGIDEVGRGPLAGPVFACCVILPKNTSIIGINDSKKVSVKERIRIYDEIVNVAIDYKIGIVHHDVIDEINILNATYEAMRSAVNDLNIKPDILLVDGLRIPDVGIMQHPIISGDSRSISIAAASILAKVTRDKYMVEQSKIYLGYDFENNKGYGTRNHIAGIKKLGPCKIHRKTFIKNIWN